MSVRDVVFTAWWVLDRVGWWGYLEIAVTLSLFQRHVLLPFLLLLLFLLLQHVHEGVKLVDVLLVNGQFLRQRVLPSAGGKKNNKPVRPSRRLFCDCNRGGLRYQVFGHGLGADVQREARQLRGVLEFPVERAQIHGEQVVLGEGRTLRRTGRQNRGGLVMNSTAD